MALRIQESQDLQIIEDRNKFDIVMSKLHFEAVPD